MASKREGLIHPSVTSHPPRLTAFSLEGGGVDLAAWEMEMRNINTEKVNAIGTWVCAILLMVLFWDWDVRYFSLMAFLFYRVFFRPIIFILFYFFNASGCLTLGMKSKVLAFDEQPFCSVELNLWICWICFCFFVFLWSPLSKLCVI